MLLADQGCPAPHRRHSIRGNGARYLVPVYLDSTFIRLYNAKLGYLKQNRIEDGTIAQDRFLV